MASGGLLSALAICQLDEYQIETALLTIYLQLCKLFANLTPFDDICIGAEK
jgi:hypothetical protein